MSTVLITGASGFLGTGLSKAMIAAGHSVVGTTTGASRGPDLLHCDITNPAQVEAVVRDVAPDIVVHSAALSSVTVGDTESYYRINVLGTENLLKATADLQDRTRFVMISTAGVYGNHPVEMLTEDLRPLPVHHYGLSKFAAERITHTFADALDFTIIRPFNIIGTGQAASFIAPKLIQHFGDEARQIRLGNIDVYRDYIDLSSASEVLTQLAVSPDAVGETINLCTGKGTSLRELLDAAQRVAGYEIEVVAAPEFTRKSEIWRLLGSSDKLVGILGGPVPTRPVESVLEEMLAAYRARKQSAA